MDFSLIEVALQQGIWAILFVTLFLYQIKDTKNREEKYIEYINGMSKQYEELTHQFETLSVRYEKMNEDLNELKTEIHLSLIKKG